MKTLIPICPTYSGGDVSYTYQAEDRAKSSDFKKILNQLYSYPCTDLVPRLVQVFLLPNIGSREVLNY